MAGNVSRPGTTVSARVLSVLAAFDTDHPALRLSEIARRADLPLPTTYRLVAELTGWGALTRRDDGCYVIGRRLWDLGLLAPVPTSLREAASPFLHDIHAATRATVHLAVRDGLSALYLDRLSGSTSVPVVSRVGSRLPLHATGVGKVLLAYAPPAFVADVVARGLPRMASGTITDPHELAATLAEVRRAGYCLSRDEMTDGAASVAAPIMGPAGDVVASVSVVVPSNTENLQPLVPAVRLTAAAVGRALIPGAAVPLSARTG